MRKYVQILCIAIIATVWGNALPCDARAESEYTVSEKIGEQTLKVISDYNDANTRWFLVSKSGKIQLKTPPSAMHIVDSLKASGDGQFLAVLSVGEGHPIIDIFKLPRVLANKETESIMEINPYPGVVNLVEWKGSKLFLKSDMLLNYKREKYEHIPGTLMLFSYESFFLDMTTKKIEPVLDILKTPVDYYGNHLLESPDEYSPMVELDALLTLNDKKAIPYLNKALKMKRYNSAVKSIMEALEKLEGAHRVKKTTKD